MPSPPPPDPPEDDAVPRAAIRAAALRGVRWGALARIAAEAGGIVSMVVLARLVAPAAFGQVATVLVVVALAHTAFHEGLRAPLVQRERLTSRHAEGAMLMALLAGIGLGALVAGPLPLLAEPLFGAGTAELLRLAALAFPISALGTVSQALLSRRLAFKRLALVETGGGLVAIVAGIALAVAGLEATALLGGQLAGQLAVALALVASAPPPWPRWRPREMGELGRFGASTMGSGVASVASQNVDYAVLATRLDAAAVGFYWRAYNLGVDQQRKVSGILQRLALALYARSSTLEEKLALRSRILRSQSLVIFPLLAGLAVTAPVVVPLALGPNWEPAVLPTQILVLAGLASAVQTGVGPLVIAVGRPNVMLRWNLSNLVIFGVVIYLAGPYGLVAVSVAVVVFRALRFLASLSLLMRRVLGIPLRQVWDDCAPALGASAVLALAGFGLVGLAELTGLPDWSATLALFALGPPLYALALQLAFPAAWADFRRLAGQLVPARVRARGVRALTP